MTYSILILPLLSGLIAQTAKFFIRSNQQKFSWSGLTSYSGMPSGHSAIVVSLVTIIGLTEGLSSPLFAMAFVMATIIIRDALGLRRYLGQHGKVLNILVKDLDDDKLVDEHYPHLLENIGHTPAQVLAGSVLGFAVSVLGYYFL